jgi:hypothetical protein
MASAQRTEQLAAGFRVLRRLGNVITRQYDQVGVELVGDRNG